MRNLKRALSLALASVMLLGMMVVGTSASYPDVTSKNNEEAIEVLKAVGVMTGDEKGNFNPDKTVTRNEMAVIMTALLDLKTKDYAGSCPLTDVPAWAEPYVAACYANGIVSGTSATTFSGDATVTAAQAALMMQKALGYFQYSSDFGEDWVVSTVKQASKIDLFKGIDVSANAPLTRNDVAQLALNTLKATMVDAEDNGIGVNPDGQLVSKYKYVEVTKDDEKYTAISGETYSSGTKYSVELGESLYNGKLELDAASAADADKLGRPAHTWQYKGDDVFTAADKADKVFVLNGDYTSDGLEDTLQDLAKNDKLSLSASTVYAINGDTKDSSNNNYDDSDVEAIAIYGTVVELYMDKNDVKTVVAYYYTLDKITDVDTEMTKAQEKDGHSAELTFDKGNTIFDDELNGYNAKTYVKDAYVAVILDKDNDIVDSYAVKPVKGSVSSKNNTDGFVTMDGTKYYKGAGLAGGTLTTAINAVTVGTKNTYGLYVDANGTLLGIDVISEEAATLDEVYYVDKVWKDDTTIVAGDPVDTYYAQLVALDGTKREVELEKADHKLPDDKNDLSNTTDYANYSALTGQLVSISDKKTGDSKANNDKFNLNLWNNDDFDLYTAVTLTEGQKIEKKDTRLAANAKKNGATAGDETFRLNSSTKYVMIEGSGKNLKVTAIDGGINFTATTGASGNMASLDKNIVITADDSKIAKYVLIVCSDADQDTVYTDEIIFIKEASETQGDGYYEQTVYLKDGTKETWNIDKSEYEAGGKLNSLSAPAFFTYAENSDGYIELGTPKTFSADNGAYWKDQKGVIAEATIAGNFLYDEDGKLLLSVGYASKTVKDINVKDAKFVDLHDTDTEFEKTIGSLSRLETLIKNSSVDISSVKLALNVTKEGATVIFLLHADV